VKIITLPHRWEWKKRSPAEMPHEIQGKLAYTESDILGGQVHQAVMYEPLASTIGGLIAFIVLVPLVPHGAPLLVDALVLGFLALVARLGWKWFEWTHSLFFFTPYRIIYIHGIVTRKLAMLPIGKVTDMRYDRSPNGQLFGYGTFIIESAGQEQALRELDFVPDPDATYKQIQDWLFGKGTTNVNLVDVNMNQPHKAVPVIIRNARRGSDSAAPEGDDRRPWWTSS
jgi:hypothetical protein